MHKAANGLLYVSGLTLIMTQLRSQRVKQLMKALSNTMPWGRKRKTNEPCAEAF